MTINKRKLGYVVKSALAQVGLIKPKYTDSQDDWQHFAQEFEFEFHVNNKFRQSNRFYEENDKLLFSFGFLPEQFTEQVIVDIGAGSRLRGKFFQNARLIVVEPLADRFMEDISWCDLTEAESVYSVPAEELISDLVAHADFVFSINVLDHCFDFEKIVKNIYAYLKPGGLTFLSFDSHYNTYVGHPLVLTEKGCKNTFRNNGFEIEQFYRGFEKNFRMDRGINGYDLNSICLNFWLRKPYLDNG